MNITFSCRVQFKLRMIDLILISAVQAVERTFNVQMVVLGLICSNN